MHAHNSAVSIVNLGLNCIVRLYMFLPSHSLKTSFTGPSSLHGDFNSFTVMWANDHAVQYIMTHVTSHCMQHKMSQSRRLFLRSWSFDDELAMSSTPGRF